MSRIRGEYWIADGDLMFADGDVGDFNHEGYAVDHAMRLFLLELGADDADALCEEKFFSLIHKRLAEDMEESDRYNPEEALCAWEKAGHGKFDGELYAVACGYGDAREYAMKKWGWYWCKGMWVGTQHLHLSDFTAICDGLLEAEDQEGKEIEDEAEVEIAVASTGKRYLVSWANIKAGNYLDVAGGETPIIPEKCAAVEAMDREAMEPCYSGKIGD